MTYIIRGTDEERNRLYYTGRAGLNWLSYTPKEAFHFHTMDAAMWKIHHFNKRSKIHGYMFEVAVVEAA